MTVFLLTMTVWFILMIIGFPIYLSLGLVSTGALIILNESLVIIPQKMFASINSFVLLSVPLFILAGEFMNTGGVTKRIINFSRALVGHIPGGLGQVNVGANLIITGISGVALAEAAGIGKILIPSMVRDGYSRVFAGCLTATASTLGPLIPPSVPLILYAVIAQASSGKMLLGGFAPGVLTAIVLMIYVYFYAKKQKKIKKTIFRTTTIIKEFKSSFFALMAPFIIFYGLFAGVFVATEAAAALVLYVFIVSKFIYREINWNDIPGIFTNTAILTSKIAIILCTAGIYNYLLTVQGVTQTVGEFVVDLTNNPKLFLIIFGLLVVLLGCFLDGLAIMFLLVPIFLPIAVTLGIDPVHFGVVLVMALMLGLITPPFGPAMFVVAEVGGISLNKLFSAIIPFVFSLLIVLIIISIFPELVMYLPNKFLG